ncbi:NYN domain-containing protein [Mycena floridula]|nr:NYN domain-containing protein [Mycena floridula]
MDDQQDPIAIFWDFENCGVTQTMCQAVATRIQSVVQHYYGGVVEIFNAYMELHCSKRKSTLLKTQLEQSGVRLVNTPHANRKQVADQRIIVDMLLDALDHPPPRIIVLISGDSDFLYPVSSLRRRGYKVVLIAPVQANSAFRHEASVCLDWKTDILMTIEPKTQKGPVATSCGSYDDRYPFLSQWDEPASVSTLHLEGAPSEFIQLFRVLENVLHTSEDEVDESMVKSEISRIYPDFPTSRTEYLDMAEDAGIIRRLDYGQGPVLYLRSAWIHILFPPSVQGKLPPAILERRSALGGTTNRWR